MSRARIRIEQQAWRERALSTRLPFRYGIAVMTTVPHVWLELEVTINGRVALGRAADHLPPKWFTKDPERDLGDEVEEMRRVLRQASRHAAGLEAATAFDLITEVYRRQSEWAAEQGLAPLLARFGASLVERAVLDAYCRHLGISLAIALRSEGFGLRLSALHASLGDTRLADWLPPQPLSSVVCRHTVGLGDPLEAAEDVAAGAPQDGLPVSLAAAIRTYGLRHFKIKVTEGPGGIERLERVVNVVARETTGDFQATLDGNETFSSVESLREFWRQAIERPRLAPLWPRLLFIEQPFPRHVALADAIGRSLAAWPDRPPLLIDESGAEPRDVARALALGYIGVSHKNCKGVLHGVANAALLAQHRRTWPDRTWVMSGEDLSNIGPLALPQDLAVQALLGNRSVERNGHHYFAGLSAWPEPVQAATLSTFPDLYHRSPAGWPTLSVVRGEIRTSCANERAFGHAALEGLSEGVAPWFQC